MNENEEYVLQLSDQRIDFKPVSKNVSVFYDESNRQVFIVIDRGSEAIIVKNPDGFIMNFCIQDRGNIFSIKFSPNYEILSLQRSTEFVEFFLFKNNQPQEIFTHKLKKNGKILGFFWTNNNEIVIISNNGIDYLQVLIEKKSLKSLKSFSLTVDWFVFQPASGILLIANGTFGNVIHPFSFRLSNVYRLNKFEVEWTKNTNNNYLQERDVTVANLYGKPRLLILRHHPIAKDQFGACVIIYTFHKKDLQPQKTDILITNLTGRFATNIVDDLVIIHHQTTKSSMIFDINLSANEINDQIKFHLPIISKCTIRPYKINNVIDYDLYSPNWVIFQPNIIIDAKYGCLWFLELNLEFIERLIKNVPILIDFLLLRRNSKQNILKVCRNIVRISKKYGQNPIGNLSLVFNKLNLTYKESFSNTNTPMDSSSSSFDYVRQKTRTTIDQKDILSNFFDYFTEDDIDNHLGIAIIFEYVYSLSSHDIEIEFFIYEFLINYLIKSGNYYQMHQFLQYHVFNDSTHLACLLLSLNKKYPYGYQLGLDMLKRLNKTDDEIIEVLLSQNQIIRALRYLEKYGDIYSVSARKFLETAYATKDTKIFHQVYKFFQLRNLKLRNSLEFVKGENCTVYEKHFENIFGSKISVLL
uniref:Regulator of MON1-CCZ1 complex-like n=1 Tax=Dermatophagoides pteronyssinus TaxID=6956 RepID=A0A6P6Y9D3_DERPT|nr:regulator of MON1-CCZ1 complex-like [Dermatophagoides pteronyssinus]